MPRLMWGSQESTTMPGAPACLPSSWQAPILDSTTFRGWLPLVYRFLVLKYHEMLLVREMTPFYKQWSPILYSLGNLLCFNWTLFKFSTWFCPLLPEQTYKCFMFSFLCFNYMEHPCQYITKLLLWIKSILIAWNAYSLICCPCTLCSSQFLIFEGLCFQYLVNSFITYLWGVIVGA